MTKLTVVSYALWKTQKHFTNPKNAEIKTCDLANVQNRHSQIRQVCSTLRLCIGVLTEFDGSHG